ncbi:FadR family transcriptional regulator [Sphingomonas sp. PL-96]|uniref:FadR/GntR family transcriptional regulator n=1 Tax=Sphingomonas sp. PL-96 TaxID=2887201 RepID=UPI001E51C2C0|nr:FadR/GntR family transcriptional regulator [Sphingomonas sp. PL-96]MCC2975444.1 FadR family transcriptional regulator [Sphingomonas sp. PL-96]
MTMSGNTGGKLYRKIVQAIIADISAGVFPIGSRLPPERDLTERFGVSRPTIREAMIALEMQGLVQSRKGSGVFVLASTTDEASEEYDLGAFEIIEARRLVEGEVAAVAATEIDDAQLAQLREALNDMAQEDVAAAEDADRRFHIGIAEATGNAVIISAVTDFWDLRFRSPLAREVLRKAGSLGTVERLEEHGRILTALEARNPAEARLAMRDHLSRVIDHLLHVNETEAVERARAETAQRRRAFARRAV